MKEISDRFCGYLNIGEDTLSYFFSDYHVTMLPSHEEQKKRWEIYERLRSRADVTSEFYYGNDGNKEIALLCKGRISTALLGLDLKAQFFTPLVVQAAGNTDFFFRNLALDWTQFHAITVYGGNINAICNPQVAVAKEEAANYPSDGAREIKVRPWEEYTRKVDVEIDGEKAILTISVMQDGGAHDKNQMGAYNLGSLNSFIRLSFDNPQGFERIERYYVIIKQLVALLTGQSNLHFSVYLSQRNSEDLFQKSAICKIYEPYDNFSNRSWHEVISIYSIFDCLPGLIQRIANHETNVIVDLLPDDNKRARYVSITNIQDLCTALEVSYSWSDRHKEKDAIIESLKKRINETIKDFISETDGIDVYKETTISSSFQYLDYTLKQRVFELYSENRNLVDFIVGKHCLPEVNEDSIGAFVKLRNRKTHSGVIEWGDSAKLYMPLLSLVYIELFRYIRLPEETMNTVVRNFF